MTSKNISLSCMVTPKNSDKSEQKFISKYNSQYKKNNLHGIFIKKAKNKNVFKKDTEIQNNSIIEEDDYNEEIYNNYTSQHKFGINEENDDFKSKSSFSSFDDKNKNIFLFHNSKVITNNEKHIRNSMGSNLDSNYTFQDSQNSKNIDKDYLYIMNIVSNFEKIHKKLDNIKNKNNENNNKKNNDNKDNNFLKNKITSKFSVKNRKKVLTKNNNNFIGIHSKSPSQPFKENNRRKNIILSKINENDNKMTNSDSKSNVISRDKKINLINMNNIKSIKKNLFNKNQQYSISIDLKNEEIKKKLDDDKAKNSPVSIELNKKFIPENNRNSNNNQILKNINSKIHYKRPNSLMDEDSLLNSNYSNKKKLEKRNNSPWSPHNIIKKKVIIEEQENEKEKNISFKNSEINNSHYNKIIIYSNSNKDNRDRNKNNDMNNNKNRNYWRHRYSNTNSQNIDLSENNSYNISNYGNKNDNDKKKINSYININVNDNNSKNNKRRVLNNSFVVSINKNNIQMPNINKTDINESKSYNEKKNNIILKIDNNNDKQKRSFEQPKINDNKNIRIKIDKPLFHSPKISARNPLVKFNDNNLSKPINNLNKIQNLKKQSLNSQNDVKIKIENGTQNKKILSNSKSCIFKNEKNGLFKKEYDYNQIIINSNNKVNNKKMLNIKTPIISIKSERNLEKRAYTTKNDDIGSEKSPILKYSVTNKNEGEGINKDDTRRKLGYSLTNLGKNNNNKDNKNFSKNIINNPFKYENNNKGNINKNDNNIENYSEKNRIYITQLGQKNNFQKNKLQHHAMKSTSLDKNIKSNAIGSTGPLNDKEKGIFSKIVPSPSMDNIKVLRRSKVNENGINSNNINNNKNIKKKEIGKNFFDKIFDIN